MLKQIKQILNEQHDQLWKHYKSKYHKKIPKQTTTGKVVIGRSLLIERWMAH
jgi:hypothetical protein